MDIKVKERRVFFGSVHFSLLLNLQFLSQYVVLKEDIITRDILFGASGYIAYTVNNCNC